jgi:hypothetical protein
MAGIALCPLCGAEYVEGITDCVDCDVALVDPDVEDDPRRAPDDEQVIYELGGWTLDQRTTVAEVMAHSHVPHAWDGDELIVHERNEIAVDRLLAPIELDVPQARFATAAADGDDAAGNDGDDAVGDESDGDADRTAQSGPVERSNDAEDLGGETTYDMNEWAKSDRMQIVSKLVEAGVKHRWEANTLVIARADEAVVDDVLDDFEEGGDERSLDDEGDETPFATLETLFLAADRLRQNPMDGAGRRSLATVLADLDESNPPFGVDIMVWHRAVSLADELSDELVGEDQNQEAAVGAASDLYALLRPFV